MNQKKVIWVFVMLTVLVPVCVFGMVKWYQDHVQQLPILGPEGHVIGKFSFHNQDNATVSLDQWKGKVVVANFFFTHCPIVCPKMMYQMKRVRAYGDKNLVMTSFTVDPDRDSVGRLKVYAKNNSIEKDWSLLTGAKIDLYRFARKDLMIVATDGDGGPDDFIHSENLVLIDRQQRIRGFYNGTDEADVDRMINDIKKISRN